MTVNASFSAVLFHLAQFAVAPVAVCAYPAAVWSLLRRSRLSGVSATVTASLYTRYMQHRLGTRSDEPAARLLSALPGISGPALELITAPTLVAHRLTGHVPRIYRYPYTGQAPLAHQSAARTTYFDAALAHEMGRISQLVVLGAGLDTRAHRFPGGTRVRCFEVDRAAPQAFKLGLLGLTGLDPGRATHVPVDFLAEDWLAKIVDVGFDPVLRTFFLWEAVTMYLDRPAVERTLDRIAGTAPGSVVAFDYFSAETIRSREPFMRYARATARLAGEPLTYGVETAPRSRYSVTRFLAQHGLVLLEHRTFGTDTDRSPAPAGFAVAAVPERPSMPPRAQCG